MEQDKELAIFRERLERWRGEGFEIGDLEDVLSGSPDLKTVNERFEEFERDIRSLRALEEALMDLDVTGFENENEVIKGKRSVTPDTALRLARVLGMSADFWLGLQQDWDLWHAMNSPEAKDISRLQPILQKGNHVV